MENLPNAPFYLVEYENDPNASLQIWYQIFDEVLNKHAPVVRKRVKNDFQPAWYNNEILHARQMRDKYKKQGLWAEYKYWRNRTTYLIDDSKRKYYSDIVKDSRDPKVLWKCIHSLNPSKPVKPCELVTENNDKVTDPKVVANTFNEFFTSCVQNLRSNNDYPSPEYNILTDFVKKRLPQNKEFIIPPVRLDELLHDILKLDANKSTGTDNISPRILKISAPFISSSLTYIFNRIIDSGTFPTLLKNAKVLPAYKAGDKCFPTNYRPISVLPTVSKLIEKHVARHMYEYLSDFNLLHPAQSGFRPFHSCQTALVNLTDKWLQEMNNGNLNVAIFLDLRKAFDVVDHHIMCKKLKIYGFHENVITFFSSYLNERTQQVQIGSIHSDKMNIKYGVPQGSILGPLLFILYINDLPLCIKNCKTDMYADDSTIHISGKMLDDVQTKAQSDLVMVEKWCNNNGMFINCEKTKCMLIGTRQKLSSIGSEIHLKIHDTLLQCSSSEKLLGVKIDPLLSWTSQIDQVCSKISSRLFLLTKIKKFLNLDARKLYYSGYILPLIDYCCVIWGNCNAGDLNRILKLQKRAARIILDTDPLSPSLPLFKKLGWMTVYDRIKYHKSLLVYKSLKKETPSYLIDKFSYISDRNPYSLRDAANGDLVVPKPKTELYKKSFAYSGSVIWNKLPNLIRNSSSVKSFKDNMMKNILQETVITDNEDCTM